jgi:hypothetical protein
MTLPPLTHHEILDLVEPFTRRGRRVDLDATNRLERRLVFKPLEHPPESPGEAALVEQLELHQPYAGTFRLGRTLLHPSGLRASLSLEGPAVPELVARLDAVPPRSQFRAGSGYLIALEHRVEPPRSQVLLSEATAQVRGLMLSMRMPTARGAADLTLIDPAGDSIPLPEDLLAVLGWNWSPLTRRRETWVSRVRLRGSGVDRSLRGEAALERTVAHLARTLAEPPRRFHERFLAARWGSALRRIIPVLTAAGLVAAVAALPGTALDDPGLRLVVLNLPLLVVGLSFTLQEGARVEVPPVPRVSRAPAWRAQAG